MTVGELLFSMDKKLLSFFIFLSGFLVLIDHFLDLFIKGLSLGGELSVFFLLKCQGVFCLLYLGEDFSPHVKEVHFLIGFEVKLFSEEFKFFINEFFPVLGFFEGINELLMLSKEKGTF